MARLQYETPRDRARRQERKQAQMEKLLELKQKQMDEEDMRRAFAHTVAPFPKPPTIGEQLLLTHPNVPGWAAEELRANRIRPAGIIGDVMPALQSILPTTVTDPAAEALGQYARFGVETAAGAPFIPLNLASRATGFNPELNVGPLQFHPLRGPLPTGAGEAVQEQATIEGKRIIPGATSPVGLASLVAFPAATAIGTAGAITGGMAGGLAEEAGVPVLDTPIGNIGPRFAGEMAGGFYGGPGKSIKLPRGGEEVVGMPESMAARVKQVKVDRMREAAIDESRINVPAIEDVLSKAKVEGEGGPRAVVGMDPRLIHELGGNLYNGDLGVAALREMTQNAVDATRPLGREGRVTVNFDANNRTLAIHDNGIGMSPETAFKEFVDIGGSKKPEGSTGGLGIAKVAIFANSDNIQVVTNDGVTKTSIWGSGTDWMDTSKGLQVKSVPATPDTPRGTSIQVTFRQEATVGAYDVVNWMKRFRDAQRLETKVDFSVNGEPLAAIDVAGNPLRFDDLGHNAKYEPMGSSKIDGANVDIYASSETARTQAIAVHVNSNGLPQFVDRVYLPNPVETSPSVIMDFHPTGSTVDPDYPFQLNREGLRAKANEWMNRYVEETFVKVAQRRETDIALAAFDNAVVTPNGFRIVDTTGKLDPELIQRMAANEDLNRLNLAMERVHGEILAVARKWYPNADVSDFAGLGLGPDYIGLNARLGALESGRNNAIIYNVFRMLDEYDMAVRETGYMDVYESSNFLAGRLVSTMVHEVSHDISMGHTETFMGVLTRLMGHASNQIDQNIDSMDRMIQNMQIFRNGDAYNGVLGPLWGDYTESVGRFGGRTENVVGRISDSTPAGAPSPRGGGRVRKAAGPEGVSGEGNPPEAAGVRPEVPEGEAAAAVPEAEVSPIGVARGAASTEGPDIADIGEMLTQQGKNRRRMGEEFRPEWKEPAPVGAGGGGEPPKPPAPPEGPPPPGGEVPEPGKPQPGEFWRGVREKTGKTEEGEVLSAGRSAIVIKKKNGQEVLIGREGAERVGGETPPTPPAGGEGVPPTPPPPGAGEGAAGGGGAPPPAPGGGGELGGPGGTGGAGGGRPPHGGPPLRPGINPTPSDAAVKRLLIHLRRALKDRGKTESLYHEELSRRAGKIREALEGPGTPSQRYIAARRAQKGELPKADFPGIRGMFSQGDLESMFDTALKHNFGPRKEMTNLNAVEALDNLLNGKLPNMYEINLLEKVFGPDMAKTLLKARLSFGEKAWRNLLVTLNVPRTLLAGFLDNSFPGLQGIKLAPRYNKDWRSMFRTSWRALFDEDYARALDAQLVNDSTPVTVRINGKLTRMSFSELKEKTGLFHAPFEHAVELSQMEELFVARWLRNLGLPAPVVRRLPKRVQGVAGFKPVAATERAYLSAGNKFRSDILKRIYHAQGPGVDFDTMKSMAAMVNEATGRGTLKFGHLDLSQFGPALSAVQFAPRNRISNVQWAAQLLNKNPAVRVEAAKQLVSFVAAGTAFLAMVKMSGAADVEVDPRSPDWGKMKVGKTRINPWGTVQPLARSVVQAITQQRKNERGDIIPISARENLGDYFEGSGDIGWRYFRSGMAPVPALGTDIATGSTVTGEELQPDLRTVKTQAYNRLTPLAWQDIIEATRAEGLKGMFLGLPSIIGVTAQTYETFSTQRAQAFEEETGQRFDPKNPGHWAILRTNENLKDWARVSGEAEETSKFLQAEIEKLSLPQMAEKMAGGDMSVAPQFAIAWEEFEGTRADAARRLAYGKDRPAADDPSYQEWRSINIYDYRDPQTFEIDFGAYRRDKEAAFSHLDEPLKEAIDQVGVDDPVLAQLATFYNNARDIRRALFDIPKYKGMDSGVSNEYGNFLNAVKLEGPKLALERGRRIPEKMVAREIAKRLNKPEMYRWYTRLHLPGASERLRNPDYEEYLGAYMAPLSVFFPELYSQAELERLGLIAEKPSTSGLGGLALPGLGGLESP